MTGRRRRVLLGLGSNLGDRDANIRRALELLEESGALTVLGASSHHTTAPVGGPPQPDYRNAAALVETTLAPGELLAAAKRVEAELGRDPAAERFGPRVIDVDLLLFGDETVESPALSVPHPRMAERRFVLEPAAEVAADMRDPRTGRTVGELLELLT